MVVLTRGQPKAFPHESFPERVWMSNLFGRATQNLVLSEQLKAASAMVDRELKVVADIQHSLLPKSLPKHPDARPGRAATRPRAGPGATITMSSRCPTAAAAS